jgi:integrase
MTFNKRLRKYCEQAGIPYRSNHKIRFYAASTAYNGQNLAQLSKMMGHSQVSTTMHYLRDAGNKDDYTSLFSRLGTQTT